MSKGGFLDKAYGLDGVDKTRDFYDAWSKSYDAEVTDNGYATPGRIAKALAEVVAADAPILDYGCGTGLSGQALREAGFTTIDGADLSADMLAHARELGLYRALWQVETDGARQIAPGDYAAIAAIGVIGSGAAPLEVLDRLMESLAPGGICAFSFNDHTLEDPGYDARVRHWANTGAVLRFEEHGPHLPGIGLSSTVYLLERT